MLLKRVVIGLATLVVLLTLAALSPAFLSEQQAAAQGGTGDNATVDAFEARTPDTNLLLDEMTLVWIHDEEYARIISSCAGVGLRNIAPHPDGPMVLIPNAGDLDVAGSTVAIKLNSNGRIEFIPRTQGQLIQVPVDVGAKAAGQEVLSLTFEEGMELMASDYMVWTAKDKGPYGNGHGLPGHIGLCDPRYPGDDFYAELEDES